MCLKMSKWEGMCVCEHACECLHACACGKVSSARKNEHKHSTSLRHADPEHFPVPWLPSLGTRT